MAVFPSFKLTEKGEELLNRSIGEGKTLTFTKFELGDGNTPSDFRKQTGLVNKFYEFPILNTSIQKDQVLRIRGYFDNKSFSQDKQLKEIGVFVKIEGNETQYLYSYTNAGDTGDIIPAKSRGFYSRTLDVANYIGYATNITFNIEQLRDRYAFNTENEMKVASYLKAGDKVELWGNLVLGDKPTDEYIIQESGEIELSNGLFAKKVSFKYIAQTIEEIQKLALKVGDIVEVLGYYQAGDGAGHKRVIANTDDGSGVQLENGLWANRVVEDSKFASLKSTKKIFEKSDGYYYRIPNSILFKNKIFILADKRYESPSDLGYNNKISISYRIYDLTTKVLSEEKFIFQHNVESNTGYSDALLYIVNEELYCMCLKYTENRPLVYSNGDIIYKKTSDGINWSEEISIKTQLSSTDLIMPSPTNAIIYKENIIIPCNKEGYIKTIDGTTYEYVNLKTGSWENNITIYDDKLFMVGRNGLYTSANFIIDNDVAYPARNYGELSNGECLSSLKIYKGYWFHLVQNSNIRRRNNLVLRVFDDINELPIAQKTIYDITNTPLDKIENYDTGYSSLEIVEDVFYITYEFYGDIITEIHTLQELFGHSDFNRKIKKAYTDDTKLNEEGTLFIPQSYNSYSFYVGSHNKVVDKIIAGDNITIINDGKCAIEYNTYTKDNSVPNQILHLDKITVFAGESISLQRILNNKNWAVTNLSKNETIRQVTTPLKDVSILDLTKNSYRNLVVYKNWSEQTLDK